MKFSISSGDLLKQLQKASGAIGSNPVIAILEDFLFEIKDDYLKISASDLETSIVTGLSVMSDKDGSVAVPGRILLDTLKALPEQPVTFEVNPETYSIELTSAYGKYKLAGENPEDFPGIPMEESADSIKLNADLIQRAFNLTSFATSNDEIRLAMTGVNVIVDFNKITFVATDAHKLVKFTYNEITTDTTQSFIIPKKSVNIVRQALPLSDHVEMSFNKTNAFFKSEHTTIACRLIDAKYPVFENAIPKESPISINLKRHDLLQSLKRIAIYANKTTNQVLLNFSDDSLTIKAQDLDFANEANEQVTCQYTGDPISIGFNAKFLIEMLTAFEDDDIILKLIDHTKAGIVVPATGSTEENLLMLIMPVMLNK